MAENIVIAIVIMSYEGAGAISKRDAHIFYFIYQIYPSHLASCRVISTNLFNILGEPQCDLTWQGVISGLLLCGLRIASPKCRAQTTMEHCGVESDSGN